MATLTQHSGGTKLPPPLPIDPWFTSPIASTTGLHALPGLLAHSAHAQSMGNPYQSYLTPGPNTIPITLSPSLANLGSILPGGFPPTSAHHPHSQGSPNGHITVTSLSPKMEEGTSPDVRSSSIVSLRMKAKEHMEHLGRTLTGPCWFLKRSIYRVLPGISKKGDINKEKQWQQVASLLSTSF